MDSILRKVSILAAGGILVTLASGLQLLIRTGASDVPDVPYYYYYGLPLAWRQVVSGGFIGAVTSTVFWFPFLLDVLFYMAVGYVLMVPYQANRAGWKLKSLPLLLVAAGYIVSVTAYAVWLYGHPPPIIP